MKNQSVPIKIRNISVRNYKGIDQLELDFPIPRMTDDPDILVMGSRNGLGKTSIIECCSLLLLVLALKEDQIKLHSRIFDIPDLLIRAGTHSAEINGEIIIGNKSRSIQVQIDRNGLVKSNRDSFDKKTCNDDLPDTRDKIDSFINMVCGLTTNPVIESKFLLFHGYRKIQEGNPDLEMMIEDDRTPKRLLLPPRLSRHDVMSEFKLRILRSLMGQADMFEFTDDQEPDETIKILNQLLQTFANGTIGKLRPFGNTVDIRINSRNSGNTYTFDGLSSGQKEIISTLFLIWYHTRKNPSVVLIDGPELHLNAQWHRSFVNRIVSLSPQNQYIIATHSEDIMDSVDKDRRVILLDNQET